MSRQYDLATPPRLIIRDLVHNKVLQLLMQPGHKLCAGRDAVRVKPRFRGQNLPPLCGLLLEHLGLPGAPEATAALLVHLGPRCHTVDGHEEHLAWLDHAEQHLNVVEDVSKDLLLRYAEMGIGIVRVRAHVDDAVHVQIQVVKLRYLKTKGRLTSDIQDSPECSL